MYGMFGYMKISDYVNGKGPLEREFVKVTGKAHMRIGRRLRKKYTGLDREEIAERLLQRMGYKRNGQPATTEEKQLTVVHSFELRPGRVARLEIPADLTTEESEKLIKLIQILQADS
jgi:hypothetical protein